MSVLCEQDLSVNWHPCAQMKDYEYVKPIEIQSAQGCFITLTNGNKIIDATASWWSKPLGHGHRVLKQALIEQLQLFEHVMFANTTNDVIVQLSQKLTGLLPNLAKVMYASDGSSAVEIALKMSLHSRKIAGDPNRNKFVTLQNSYHGETIAALSVSDCAIYKNPYQALLFPVEKMVIPYVITTADPIWNDAKFYWQQVKTQLEPIKHTITAIIVEPILQAASGMRIYSQDFLKRLSLWCQAEGIHVIADEIMTGLGRTGTMLASQHANIAPDFICLGKGLTGGFLPMSAVVTTNAIYQFFYDDYESGKSFFHSHTYSGNVLAAKVALAMLTVMQTEKILEGVEALQGKMLLLMEDIAQQTGKLTRVRGIGAVVAAELIADKINRPGFEFFKRALSYGALMRPIGNTIYWTPPLNITDKVLSQLADITKKVISFIR